MSVKYVYIPESRVALVIPFAVAGLLLAAVAAIAVYFWLSDDNLGLASFLADDTATVYVVDNSGSIAAYVWFLTDQVQKIGMESQENSEAALILFGSQNKEVLPLDSVGADKWRQASAEVSNSMGNTNLFSAAIQGVTLLEEVAPGIHRRLVILTDGKAGDESLMPELVDSANKLGVSIDTIALGDDAYSSTLRDLSSQTGGTFYDWQAADEAIN